MRSTQFLALFASAALCLPASAGYLLEVDVDGADDGPIALHPNFSYGGNTTSASTSAASGAVGLAGADSIFGGDAPSGLTTPDPDTYVYTYTPGVDGDNDDGLIGDGTPLNDDGDYGTGVATGGSAVYSVFVTWPFTSNVSNTPVNWVINDGTTDVLSVSFDQNGLGGEWIKLGDVFMDASTTYTVTQTNTPAFVSGGGLNPDSYTNGFVSQRFGGAYFAIIPEPTSALLALVGCGLLGANRRR